MMDHMKLCYMMSLSVLGVLCKDNLAKQPHIYDEHGLAKVNFFTKKAWTHVDCMNHCLKMGGRSPPVRTETELDEMLGMFKDLKAFSPIPPKLFLSVTRGEVNNDMETQTLEHWPEDVLLKTDKLWRDYYTGEQLKSYNETWAHYVGNLHCAQAQVGQSNVSLQWTKLPCSHVLNGADSVCSCTQPVPLLLRGLCSSSNLKSFGENQFYKPQHLPESFDRIFFVSLGSQRSKEPKDTNPPSNISRIDYNHTTSQWVFSSTLFSTTAFSLAKNETYVLGKHNWTFTNDHQQCHLDNGKNKDENYTIELKLSGCNQSNSFTCNDGQCVSMEKRCDQLADCKDDSDEKGCKLFSLVEGYNNIVSPFKRVSYWNNTIVPVLIEVSITLLKLMGIDERENTISLQFEIILEWKDQRITYSNLKMDPIFNALTEDEMKMIWLPTVIYANTDQKETTRLGWVNEWSTSVVVSREGNFMRQVLSLSFFSNQLKICFPGVGLKRWTKGRSLKALRIH